MTAFIIRDFRPEDEPAATALIDELNRHEASYGARRRTTQAAARDCFAEDTRKSAGNGGRIVLELDGQVLAYAAYRYDSVPAFMPQAGAPELFVENVVVTESARGRGYGRAMLDEMARRARAASAARMVLHVVPGNAEAMRAYERTGFKTSSLEMERQLGSDSEEPA